MVRTRTPVHGWRRAATALILALAIPLAGAGVAAASEGRDPAYHATPNVYCGPSLRAGDIGSILLGPPTVAARDFVADAAEVETVEWAVRLWRWQDAAWQPDGDWVFMPSIRVDERGTVESDGVVIGGTRYNGELVREAWNMVNPGFYTLQVHFSWSPRLDVNASTASASLFADAYFVPLDPIAQSASPLEVDWCHFPG